MLSTLMTALADALRKADFAAMESLAGQIDAALEEVATLKQEELSAIGRMAAENARGLDAARQGVRAARRRLAEISAAERGLTYDRTGALCGIAPRLTGLRF